MVNLDSRTRKIAEELGISFSTVHGILSKELGISNVSARWLQRLPTDKEKVHGHVVLMCCLVTTMKKKMPFGQKNNYR